MSLRIAVVGCGGLGMRRAHTLHALGIDDLRFTDQDDERARKLQTALGGRVVKSASAAAATADAVVVCTPPASRVGLALEGVRAGAHAFVEAPVADGLGGVGLLLEAAASRGRAVMVGSRLRFHPAMERIRSLLQARTLGRVYAGSIWVGVGVGSGESASGAANAEGAVASGRDGTPESVQWLDAMRWIFGQPFDVTAVPAGACPEGKGGDDPGADISAAILRFESGLLLQLYADGLRGQRATHLELVGTEGTLSWSAAESRITLQRSGGTDRRVERVPVDPATLEEAEMRHFLACVLTGRTPVSDGLEGRATLSLALALQRSARLRRALPVGDGGRRSSGRRAAWGSLRLVHAT
jgi:UDP-N-acetylglucosamine 3-dehydrogenase